MPRPARQMRPRQNGRPLTGRDRGRAGNGRIWRWRVGHGGQRAESGGAYRSKRAVAACARRSRSRDHALAAGRRRRRSASLRSSRRCGSIRCASRSARRSSRPDVRQMPNAPSGKISIKHPRNARSLFGLQAALARQGRDADAALVQREFDAAWKNADSQAHDRGFLMVRRARSCHRLRPDGRGRARTTSGAESPSADRARWTAARLCHARSHAESPRAWPAWRRVHQSPLRLSDGHARQLFVNLDRRVPGAARHPRATRSSFRASTPRGFLDTGQRSNLEKIRADQDGVLLTATTLGEVLQSRGHGRCSRSAPAPRGRSFC